MSFALLNIIKKPKLLYSTESKINGRIEVIQVGDVRKVKVGGFEQSINWNTKYTKTFVWGKAVDVIKNNKPSMKNILIFGLGGGTVQHLIAKSFPQVDQVSIEIDPVMVDVAKNYFDINSIPNHKIITEDAYKVVEKPENYGLEKGSFDVVYIDIYVGSLFPDFSKSDNFFSMVKAMVASDGLVIINRFYTEQHRDEVNKFIDNTKMFLQDVNTLVVSGWSTSDNILIYGRN